MFGDQYMFASFLFHIRFMTFIAFVNRQPTSIVFTYVIPEFINMTMYLCKIGVRAECLLFVSSIFVCIVYASVELWERVVFYRSLVTVKTKHLSKFVSHCLQLSVL